ncbi:hypothetical protein [Mycoplasma todarodis]|uniref:Uncharacterized protein n=1 Tax=Mycoplasma todarodis TaxID=1937191 RepID=A0A4R0XVS8_9MOLU|nr:hypothetical protein [Mycoplasma todarodis]TCG11974.1 hypothetical protein C4B25_00520 [Mycoplasma todarodis]
MKEKNNVAAGILSATGVVSIASVGVITAMVVRNHEDTKRVETKHHNLKKENRIFANVKLPKKDGMTFKDVRGIESKINQIISGYVRLSKGKYIPVEKIKIVKGLKLKKKDIIPVNKVKDFIEKNLSKTVTEKWQSKAELDFKVIRKLRNKYEETKNKIDEIKGELIRNNNELAKAKLKQKETKDALDKAKAKVEKIQKDLNQKTTEINKNKLKDSQLRKDLKDARDELERNKKKIEDLDKDISDRNSKNIELNKKINDLLKTKEKLEKDLKDINKEITNSKNEKAKLVEDLKKAQKDLKDASDGDELLKKEIKSAREQVPILNKKLADAKEALRKATEDAKTAKDRLDSANAKTTGLNKKLADAKGVKKVVDDKIKANTTQITDLQNQLKELNKQLQLLLAKRDELARQKEELLKLIDSLTSQKEHLEDQKKLINVDITKDVNSIVAIDNAINDENEKLSKNQMRLKEIPGENDRNEKNILRLQKNINDLNAADDKRVSDTRKEYARITGVLSWAQITLRSREQDLANLKISGDTEAIKKVAQAIVERKELIKTTLAEKAVAQEKLTNAEDQKKQHKTQIDKWKQDIQNRINKRLELKREKTRIENENSVISTNVQNLSDNKQTKETNLINLRNQKQGIIIKINAINARLKLLGNQSNDSEIISNENKIKAILLKIKELTKELEKLVRSNSKLEVGNATNKTNVDEAQKAVDDNNDLITEATKDKKDADKKVGNAKTAVDEAQKAVDDNKKRIENLVKGGINQAFKQAKDDIKEINNKIGGIENKIIRDTATKKKLEKDLASKTDELNNTQKTINDNDAANSKATKDKGKINGLLKGMQKKKDEAQKAVDNNDRNVNNLAKDQGVLEKQLKDAKQALGEAVRNNDSTQKSVNDLLKTIEDNKIQIKKLLDNFIVIKNQLLKEVETWKEVSTKGMKAFDLVSIKNKLQSTNKIEGLEKIFNELKEVVWKMSKIKFNSLNETMVGSTYTRATTEKFKKLLEEILNNNFTKENGNNKIKLISQSVEKLLEEAINVFNKLKTNTTQLNPKDVYQQPEH